MYDVLFVCVERRWGDNRAQLLDGISFGDACYVLPGDKFSVPQSGPELDCYVIERVWAVWNDPYLMNFLK